MSNKMSNKLSNKMKEAWESGPIGKITVTLFCIPLGPLGWLAVAAMWGIYFLNKKKN